MPRILSLFLVLLLAGSTLAWSQSATSLRNSGKRKMLAQKYDEAIADFTQGLALDPNDQLMLSYRAESLRGAGKSDEALRDMDRYIALNPANPEAYSFRAELHSDLRAYDKMLADCDVLLRLQPEHFAHLANRGIAKAHLQDSTGSFADLNRALELAPAAFKADVLLNRGIAHQVFGHHRAAWNDFTACLARKPKDALAYFKRCQIALALNDPAQALRDVDAALRLSPSDPDALALREQVLAQAAAPVAPAR